MMQRVTAYAICEFLLEQHHLVRDLGIMNSSSKSYVWDLVKDFGIMIFRRSPMYMPKKENIR
jgi:hypothetical protein